MGPSAEQRLGNDTSFERLYRLHRRDVYGAVLRDVRDPTEAEDVTQIAFLNAFRAMRNGERPDKPRAWLVTIARNVIRRRYRELMRRPQEVRLEPEVAAALAEVDGPTAGEITAAIARIPPNQRTVILLREVQGRSYAEIAAAMGLSLAAVETLIFRARRSLSEELELVDRVPTTQRRRRGLCFLPLPGLSKLSLGFSLSRAGAAALVGGVAIVAVPIESGADGPRASAPQRAPGASAVGPGPASPTASAPTSPVRPTEASKAHGERASSGRTGGANDAKLGAGGPETPSLPAVGVPPVVPAAVGDGVAAPALPVQPPALPSPPPPPVELPPPPVELPPPPVEPPPLPPTPPLPGVPPLPG